MRIVDGGEYVQKNFLKNFSNGCKKMNNISDDDGILAHVFRSFLVLKHGILLLILYRNAGFIITATWPVHTENSANPLAQR